MSTSLSQVLGSGRPWLTRFYTWVTAHLGTSLELEVVRDKVRFLLDLREHSHCLMLLNLAENRLRRRMLGLLKPGGFVVDVGAHVGFWALPAAYCLGPQGRVLAIEPNPWAVDSLRRNIRLNQRSCRLSPINVIPHAAGSEEGQGELVAYHLIANASQASLFPPSRNRKTLQRVPVSIRKLDELVHGQVDLLKVDVEGNEPAVLAGASRLLAESPPAYLVLEIHGENLARAGSSPEALVSFIERLGYEPIDSDGDFLFPWARRSLGDSFFATVAWQQRKVSSRQISARVLPRAAP